MDGNLVRLQKVSDGRRNIQNSTALSMYLPAGFIKGQFAFLLVTHTVFALRLMNTFIEEVSEYWG